MNREEVAELAKSGEGYTLELKEKIPGDLGRTICAFANSSGGKIILGVNDRREITGIRLSNDDCSRIHDTARNLDPSFEVIAYLFNLGTFI